MAKESKKKKFEVEKIGIKGEELKDVATQSRGGLQGLDPQDYEPAKEEMLNPSMLFNRNNHPMTLEYNGMSMVVPPRGKVKIANFNLLKSLPKGMMARKVEK